MKYIKIDWPESQKFMKYEDETYVCAESSSTLFVPENLYNEVMYKLEFPKKYENTNLGTIVCYETRAIVNGEDIYWYDWSESMQKDSEVLIYNHNLEGRPEWIISKCVAYLEGLPILFEDSLLCPGLNCEIVGVKYN